MHPNACSIGLFDGDRVLLIERRYPPAQGLWTFPGGRIELGETPQLCIERELFEETGLMVSDPVQVLVESFGEGKDTFTLAVFAARHPGVAPILSDEIADWEWVHLDEIQGYRTTRHLNDIARTCYECLSLSAQDG